MKRETQMKAKPFIPIAYSIHTAAAALSISVTNLKQEIREGRLRAKKRGSRTLVLVKDLNEYAENLEGLGGADAAS